MKLSRSDLKFKIKKQCNNAFYCMSTNLPFKCFGRFVAYRLAFTLTDHMILKKGSVCIPDKGNRNVAILG